MTHQETAGQGHDRDSHRGRTVLRTAGALALTGVVVAATWIGIDKAGSPEGLRDPAVRHRAELVINSFEYGDSNRLDYARAQRLDDGRGITAGRAGFTSGTSDLLAVVQRYDGRTDRSDEADRLDDYLPALQDIEDVRQENGQPNPSTEGLDGFEDAWREASQNDPALNAAQDAEYDKQYFDPAMRVAEAQGIDSPAGQLAVLDAGIMQGFGQDADGLPALVGRTNQEVGTAAQIGEEPWVQAFLDNRRDTLLDPANEETAQEWGEAADRVNGLAELYAENPDLDAPLEYTAFDTTWRVEE